MVKGIKMENIGDCLMIFCATLIAFDGVFLFFVERHSIFISEIIVALIVFGIGGYLKLNGVKKSKVKKNGN